MIDRKILDEEAQAKFLNDMVTNLELLQSQKPSAQSEQFSKTIIRE